MKMDLDSIINVAIESMIEVSIDNYELDKCRDYDDLHDIVMINNYENVLQDDSEYEKFCRKLKLINIEMLNYMVEEAFEYGIGYVKNKYNI